jgi:glycosyltransferase involved in cell wall biosynthesis
MTKPEVNLALYSRHFHNPSRRGVAIYAHELAIAMSNLLKRTKICLLDCFLPSVNYAHMPQISNSNFQTLVLRCPGRVFDSLNRYIGWPRLEMVSGDLHLMHVMHEQVPETRIKHVVMTVHGLGPLLYPDLFHTKFRRIWTDCLERGLKKATRVIAVSISVERQLRHYYPQYSAKYASTLLGVSHGFLAKPNPQEEKKLLLFKNIDFPYILYVGAADPGKNLTSLLNAFCIFMQQAEPRPPHHLVLVGKPDWGEYRQLQHMINQLPVADRIHLTGYIEHNHLPALYRGCDLFVFPSLFEGFGLPVLEAMASGAPCLISNRPALDEVGGNIAEYFDPESPEDMAHKIKLLLENPDRLTEMRLNGREYAREFSWERTAKETIRIYEEVLGSTLY